MKAKKLTKREWYLAAQWRHGEDLNVSGITGSQVSSSWQSAVDAVGGRQEKIDVDYVNRRHFYVQYCLERAGIPAGDR